MFRKVTVTFLGVLVWGFPIIALAGQIPSASSDEEEFNTPRVRVSTPVLKSTTTQVVVDETIPDTLYKSQAKPGEEFWMTYRGAGNNGVPYTKRHVCRGGEWVYRWKSTGRIAQWASCLNVVAQPPREMVTKQTFEVCKTVTYPPVKVEVPVPVDRIVDRIVEKRVEVPVDRPVLLSLQQVAALPPQAVVGGNYNSSQYGCIGWSFGGGSRTTINAFGGAGGTGIGAAAAAAAAASSSTSTAVTPTSGAGANNGSGSSSSGASP